MSVEADVANQIVSQGLQVTEHATKLAALGAKHLAALLIALAKSHVKTHGKTALTDLVMSSSAPQYFEMSKREATKFKRLAKGKGVIAIPFRDKTSKNNVYSVAVRGEDAEKVNEVFKHMGYAVPEKDKEGGAPSKNAPTRAPQGKESQRRGSTSMPSQPNKPSRTPKKNTKPSVVGRVEALKEASKSTGKAGQQKQRTASKSGKRKTK